MTGTLALLDVIAGRETAGFIEVRWALPVGMRAAFFPVGDVVRAGENIWALGERADVYVGAAPRTKRASGRDAIERAWCLWVDCDEPAAVERLFAFTPKPRLVVRSGSGRNVHAWWPLLSALSADDVERANRRLAHHLGADPKCFNASRIMRPPGTLNFKSDPPRPVECLWANPDTTAHEALAIVGALADPPRGTSRRGGPRRVVLTGDDLAGISPRIYVPALSGVELDAANKIPCPFHEDFQPSLHAYPTSERGWYCFQCERGGTIYDFAGELWGMGTRGAEFVALKARLREALQ